MAMKHDYLKQWWNVGLVHENEKPKTGNEYRERLQDVDLKKDILSAFDQDDIFQEIQTSISPELQGEIKDLVEKNIQKGLLDIKNAKAYIERDGEKKESDLFVSIKQRYGLKIAVLTWIKVRTKAFKRWFGDWEHDSEHTSKVVDAHGEPLVMFRWDDRGKSFFEKRHNIKNKYGNGVYVTKNYETALGIAQTWYDTPIVYPVFVKSYKIQSYPKSKMIPNEFFLKAVGSLKKEDIIAFTNNLHKQWIDLNINDFMEMSLGDGNQVKSIYNTGEFQEWINDIFT